MESNISSLCENKANLTTMTKIDKTPITEVNKIQSKIEVNDTINIYWDFIQLKIKLQLESDFIFNAKVNITICYTN
jgi:hypothetical protein